ncbi:hypothetical protein [Collinsella provencensis]|uniref:hypothetical protein n=1 Tax=Collinsella provencensis TaxID=1937461 RepID=UPI000C840C5D|nr:hypothetical protein [Collinsella provencensis]
MPANWAFIITYALVFCFAIYIGFFIGQELCKRWAITAKAYWAANIGGIVMVVLATALIPALMVQVTLIGLLAGYITGLKMTFGESSGPWKWVDNFMNINRRHRQTAEKGSGEAARRRRKTGESGPDLISVDEQGSATNTASTSEKGNR